VALRAQAHVDTAAITANAATLRAATAPGTRLCAVVKADGYGHGAARAAAHAGADWLAVATALEAADLRAAGVTVPRILVMGALAWAVSSGPLSQRTFSGAPRSAISR